MDWTTVALLARIRARSGRPNADPDFTDAVLLGIADDVTSEVVLPAVHAIRQDYGVATTDIAIVEAQSDYPIPSRAAFGVVREVVIVDANGETLADLPWAEAEERPYFAGSGNPTHHTIEGDRVVLLPTPSTSTGTLRIKYYRRPSVLVAASTSSDELPHAITLVQDEVLTIGTHAFDLADVVDVVQGKPPFDVLAQDVALAAVAATTVTLPAAVSTIAIGDYVCTAGETPVVQLTAELHPVVALGAAAEVLRRAKDAQAAAREAEFVAKLERVISAMSPRQHGESKRVVNHHSYLRGGGHGSRWGRGWR